MKKIPVSLLLLCAICISTISSGQLRAGVKGGMSMAHLSGYDGSSRLSIHLGVFAHRVLNNNFAIQAELLYSGEGQKYTPVETERTIALGFAQVPVMIQYYPAKKFFLETGPQFSVLAGATDKGPNGDNVKVTRSFQNTDFSWGFGLGISATKKIIVYGRYNLGFTDMTLYNGFIDHSQVAQVGLQYFMGK